jgi:putative transposase
VLTEDADTLSHTMRDCKRHVVFIPQYRRKALSKGLQRHLAAVFRSLAERKKGRVEGSHLIPDHVHNLLAIPPQYAAAQVEGRERNV